MESSAKSSSKKSKPVAKSAGVTKSAKSTTRIASLKLDQLSSVTLKDSFPEFKTGDKVVVKSKVKEGDKERLQAFEGVVMARKGRGVSETFTVRKVSGGIGVERVFPLHSPKVASIEVKVEGFVRRGKLYYVRELEGKASRIRDKSLRAGGSAHDSVKAQETAQATASETTNEAASNQ